MIEQQVTHEEKQYILRFKDGAEIGLGGITGFSTIDGDLHWFDKDGPCWHAPRESVIFHCPKPDEAPEEKADPTDEVEEHIQRTHPPADVKDKIAEASHTEAQRYLLRNKEGQMVVVDTDNPTVDLKIHEEDAGPFGEVLKLANETVEAKKNGGYQDDIKNEGAMHVVILDVDPGAVRMHSEGDFNKALNDGDYSVATLPVVVNAKGEAFRFEVTEGGDRALRRCEMKTSESKVEE